MFFLSVIAYESLFLLTPFYYSGKSNKYGEIRTNVPWII